MTTSTVDWAARARELDDADPLGSFVAEFVPAPGVVSYLDGNSLGRPLRSFAARMASFIADDWGTRLIRRWDEAWMAQPYERCGPESTRSHIRPGRSG